MASTEGLVPITRRFLASYYDKYPFVPSPRRRFSPLRRDPLHYLRLAQGLSSPLSKVLRNRIVKRSRRRASS
ncbi:hypothetical protein OIU76_009884 [Salix suchowensis]|nr:hypothetical protein OIU76_009884 [Salix suchowensis]